MRASLPDASVAALSVGRVDVREVAVGPLHVGRLVLEAVHVDLSTGSVAFRDLRVTVVLAMRLDWRVTVKVPPAGSFSWHGTVKMGSHSLTVRLGDVKLPGLQTFSLDLPRLSVDDVDAVVGPVRDLDLGPLLVEQLRLQGVVAPVPDFHLTGLGVGRVGLRGLSLPTATSTGATIDRLHGPGLPVGSATIADLRLPEASASDIRSGAVDAQGTSNPVRFVADAGVLELTLQVTPSARIRARELRLAGVRTAAAVGTVELADVVLPYDLLGLTLSDIGIEEIAVPELEVTT